MALSPAQQALDHVFRAKHVLLTTREHASMDEIAAVIAFGLLLNQWQKPFEAVIPGFQASQLPAFLRDQIPLKSQIGALQTFHLKLNVKETPLSELRYEVKDGVLDITVTPKHGSWTPQDVNFRHGQSRYDLIVALGCPDQASLGSLIRDHREFVFQTTVLNIDHSPANEAWGQVNLLQPTATSVTELLFTWLKEMQKPITTPGLATALLTGMIAKTKSFKDPKVTPLTLAHAAALMEAGAARERIVHELWRHRSVDSLKLWGKVLSRLESKSEGILWSHLQEADEQAALRLADEVRDLADELLTQAPDTKLLVLFVKHPGGVVGHALSLSHLAAHELTRPFGGLGSKEQSHFILTNEGKTPTDVLTHIEEQIRRLG